MQGCNPEKNKDWYDTAESRFGGDDFGEHFDAQVLKDFVDSGYKRINFKFTASRISVSFTA